MRSIPLEEVSLTETLVHLNAVTVQVHSNACRARAICLHHRRTRGGDPA